jgi:hypothetical protein
MQNTRLVGNGMNTRNFIAINRGKSAILRSGLLLLLITFLGSGFSSAASPVIKEPLLIKPKDESAMTKPISPIDAYIQSLQQSIDKATQWATSKPDDEGLWIRLRLGIERILYGEWMKGRLQGSKPSQAYFVTCDRTTMSQNDIDNGRAICLIGVAPLRPAEFTEFRLARKTATTP